MDILEQKKVSINEIKLFTGHPVWECIVNDLEQRLNDNHLLMETAPPEDLYGEKGELIKSGVKRLQCDSQTIRGLLALPQLMMDELEANEKLPEEKEE